MIRSELKFLENVVNFIEAKTIVEVGVQVGDMAVHLCRASINNGGKYFGFDLWNTHGLKSQFKQQGSKESVSSKLEKNGLHQYTLIEMDTINNREGFESKLDEICPNGIDFAFIDADHSYLGISNDFFAVYPRLSPKGIIVFHDTARIDGCREFVFDLRTKYNDGTFDIMDFPFGMGDRHCGVTLLSKRTLAILPISIDEVCGSINEPHIIEQKEVDWLNNETMNKPTMPKNIDGEILIDKIGFYKRQKFEKI